MKDSPMDNSNPTEDSIRHQMNAIFQSVFDDPSIQIFDAMSAKDLEEWDSLSHITLVLAIEESFGIRLKTAEVGGLLNVGEMITLVAARTGRS